MAKNTGLGKGLNALFNEEKIIKEVVYLQRKI